MDVDRMLMDRVRQHSIDTAIDNEVAKATDPNRTISPPTHIHSHGGLTLYHDRPYVSYERKMTFREKRAIKKSGCDMEDFSKLVAWYAKTMYPEYKLSVEDGLSYIGGGHWRWHIYIPV